MEVCKWSILTQMSDLMCIILQAPGCLTLHLMCVLSGVIWTHLTSCIHPIWYNIHTFLSADMYIQNYRFGNSIIILKNIFKLRQIFEYLNVENISLTTQSARHPSLAQGRGRDISENIRTDLKLISHSSSATKLDKNPKIIKCFSSF